MSGLLRKRLRAFFLIALMVALVAAVACKGSAGPQGPVGQSGQTGQQGIQGPPGGQGPQGDQGVPGPAGFDGPSGPQGEEGPEGPQGPEGPTGSNAAVLVHDSTSNVAGSVEFRTGGTTIAVMGGGFVAGEGISITARPRGFDVLLADTSANDHNAFLATIQLPSSFTVGPESIFTITASGDETGPVDGVFILVDKVPGN